MAPPANAVLFALALSGLGWFFAVDRQQVRRLWNEHRGLLVAVLLLAVAILASEAIGKVRGEAPAHALPSQPGLLLCLPPLALFLPLFYLAWGPILEQRVGFGRPVPRRAMLLLPWIWLLPAVSVQSRSAFAGAFAAALLAVVGASRVRHLRTWSAVAALALLAGAAYWVLFAENKSGAELRLAYLDLYLRKAIDPRWLATGRSLYLETGPAMFVPGMTALHHSHND
ncbi:MAG TPA: hypothetical protein VGE20_08305, partial [Ramlibacter sp.]